MGLLLVTLLLSVSNAWVLTVLWGWFMVPAFGLPPLSLVAAYGVRTILGLLFYRGEDMDEAAIRRKVIRVGIIGPVYALLVGWVAHLFL